MKNLNSKGNTINSIFSAFLVIGYIICAYFFSSLATQLTGNKGAFVQILIMTVFGLLLFYATRVGDGKQIRRFNPAALVLIVLPALYIIFAYFFPNFPFSAAINPALAQQAAQQAVQATTQTASPSIILMLACVALGYGLPYTFFAGYEIREEDDGETAENAVVEGGIAADLAEAEAEETAEEAVEAAEETAEEVADAAEEAEEKTEVADKAEEADEKTVNADDTDEDSAEVQKEEE